MSVSYFIQKVFTVRVGLKVQSRQKTLKIGGFGACTFYSEGIPKIMDVHF